MNDVERVFKIEYYLHSWGLGIVDNREKNLNLVTNIETFGGVLEASEATPSQNVSQPGFGVLFTWLLFMYSRIRQRKRIKILKLLSTTCTIP